MSAAVFAAREGGAVLRGAPNFRDIGGLRSLDGRTVRAGRVFRSGHLGDLHPEDIGLLQGTLGREVCVIDLRGRSERAAAPACALPGAIVHSLPIEPTVAARLLKRQAEGLPLTPEVTHGFMCDAYRGFVRRAGAQLAAFFGHVLAAGEQPVVLHCAAGKDRTGFIAAMLLAVLEVPRDAVLQDYLHTNVRVAARENGRFPPEIMRMLTTVQAEFLLAAFEEIDSGFGGVDSYLHEVGLGPGDRDRLHALLLS